MQAPLTIRFATDHSAAKSGMQDLAASVVSNMVKVSDAMNTGVQANGGYVNTIRTLASSIGSDFAKVGKAGLQAANDSSNSVVAITDAVVRSAASTQTAGVLAKGGWAVTSEAAKANLAIVRNETAATVRVLASSPLFVNTATLVTGLIAVKLAYDLITTAARAASDALEGTAKIGDQASKLGISTTFLQTYTAQARTLRVDVDDLVKSLETAKAAFTVKLGEGGPDSKSQSSFQARLRQHADAGNLTSEQVDRFSGAVGTEAQFRVALDLMTELQGKGRDLAALDLASKIFPPEIVERIRSGSFELDRLRKTMDDIKNPDLVLLKPEEITRAQELQRRLEAAKATLDVAAKQFNQELIQAGAQLKEDAINWTELMARGAKAAVNILQSVRNIAREYVEGGAGLSSKNKPNFAEELGAAAVKPREATKTAEQQQMEDALNKLRGNLGNKTLIEQAQAASIKMTDGFTTDQSKSIGEKKDKPSASKSESFDAVETYINGLEKTAAAVKAETEAFGKSNAEKAAAINLAKLKETADQQGITVTEDQTEKVRAASVATAQYRDKLQDLEQAQQQAAETARYFGNALSSGFADALLEAKSFSNVILDIDKMLARSALQAVFTGQGPLAGFLGMAPAASAGGNSVGGLAGFASSLFGSGNAAANAPLPGAQGPTMESGGIGSFFSGLFRANGGPVRAGQAYTVGEIGQEIFVPGQDGMIVPAGRGGGGAGGAPVLNFIDQRPAGSGDIAPTTRRNADGSTDILIRQLDAGLQARGQRGQGGLSSALNTPGSRRG